MLSEWRNIRCELTRVVTCPSLSTHVGSRKKVNTGEAYVGVNMSGSNVVAQEKVVKELSARADVKTPRVMLGPGAGRSAAL